jgi:biopolymer transport protein ExbB/TolQ
MHRYFASHPILYFETGMFFVGMAALLLKANDLVMQTTTFSRVELPPVNQDSLVDHCRRLTTYCAGLTNTVRGSYLVQRLLAIVEFVDRRGTASGLDDELKYLADQDAMRQQESYSLVRIVAWATPMLGFLGTVVGITQALGDLDPKLFASNMDAAMQGLLSGLYVAFDTTALALVLSLVLMFLLFFADRVESQLLVAVDQFVNREAARRFGGEPADASPYLRSVERMSQAVIKTTETLIRQQTDQWQAAMADSTRQIRLVAEATGDQIRSALTSSLDLSLQNHADRLARFEAAADEQLQARWDQWQSALANHIQVVRDQQAAVTQQTELIARISQAAGDVMSLQQALNQNLHALAGAGNFEQTVLSLSAAIQLLSAKLSHLPDRIPAVELRASSQGKAA